MASRDAGGELTGVRNDRRPNRQTPEPNRQTSKPTDVRAEQVSRRELPLAGGACSHSKIFTFGQRLIDMGRGTDGCKVDRMADKYGLHGIDEELRRRHADEESLRALQRFLNARILERELQDAGADPLGAPADIYDQLVDDDTDAGKLASLEAKLRQRGVDLEAVRNDFVSHVTVGTHLNDCLNRSTEREPDVTPRSATETIAWSRTRMERIVAETLGRLENTDQLDIADPTVAGSITITCEECGSTHTPRELVDRGSCDCESPPERA